MIRVLLCDDHPVVRAGYGRLLEQAGGIRVVCEACDTDTGYAAFGEHWPDVVVTDLTMPGGGGLELIRRIRQRDGEARIVVISMHDSELLVRRAFDAGARGFLSKTDAPEALVDAVRALHEDRRYLGPELPRAWLQADSGDEAGRLASLSPREFEVFRMLALGLSPNECADLLHLSVKTVSNHQTTVKEKLGVATSAALAHLALRHRVIAPAAS